MQFPSVSFRPVAELAAYGRNARQHSPQQIEQIAVSIREFGWTLPVLADANGIVAGHARVAAAQLLYEAGERIRLPNGELVPDGTVPVLDCTGWTTAQRRAYVLADNRLAESATWDAEILAEELSNLLDMGFDVELLGFEADDLEALRPDEVIADLLDADEAPTWSLPTHRTTSPTKARPPNACTSPTMTCRRVPSASFSCPRIATLRLAASPVRASTFSMRTLRAWRSGARSRPLA
jgi:hypothetical protein